MAAYTTWGMTTIRADDWRDYAACLGEDPDLFFTEGFGQPSQAKIELAKAVCSRCPVKKHCLEWAFAVGDDWAVCGGTTPAERRGTTRARQNLAEGKCPNGHPWNSDNVRVDRRDVEYCATCRRESAAKSHEAVLRRKQARTQLLAEQFPPVPELVQELPGVMDRPRRAGRPVMSS